MELRRRYLVAGGVVACMAAVVLIAVYLFLPQSLRTEEARHMWQASNSLAGTLTGSAHSLQMPLYPALLHGWQFYFGNDVITVRLLSLLAFVATVPLFYVLARHFLDRRWALIATMLLSLSPFMNWLASDAQPYALLGLLAVCSQLFFMRVLTKRKGWLAYALFTVLGLYTHYFFAAVLLVQIGMSALSWRTLPSKVRLQLVYAVTGALILWLPWLCYMYTLGPTQTLQPLPEQPSSTDVFGVFSQFLLGFQSSSVQALLIACWPLLILVGFFAVQQRQHISPKVLYVTAAGLMPVILAYIVSLFTTPFFASHYMVAVVAPFTILVMWLTSHYRRVFAVAACSIAVAGSIFALYHQAQSPVNPAKQDYQAAASIISTQATARDVVVLTAPEAIYAFGYYYRGSAKVATLPQLSGTSDPSPAPLPLQVDSINRNHQDIYVLVGRYQGHEKQVVEYYDTHSKKVSEQHLPSSLQLFVYKNY